MSDLETLKAHPRFLQRYSVESTTDGPRHIADRTGDWVEYEDAAELVALVQQHEATIAERTAQRDECGRLAAEEAIKVLNLRANLAAARSDLAKAQETIAERDAAIKEKDAKIAELEQLADLAAWNVCNIHTRVHFYGAVCPACRADDYRSLLHSEQQAHAATREELRKADEALMIAAFYVNYDAPGAALVGDAYDAAVVRHSARAQQAEAKKEDTHD